MRVIRIISRAFRMWRRRLFFGQIRSTENYEFSVNVDNYNIITTK